MVITCILCKKDWTPFNPLNQARSFHKFPKNNDLKKKWMNAIGLSAVPKTAVICSDHFDGNAFHETDGNTSRRRLLSDAVPRDKNLASSQRFADCTLEISTNIVAGCSDQNIERHDSSTSAKSTITKDSVSYSLKRKRSIIDVHPSKKIRFVTGFKTEHISREDFVSDEAWQRFMRYTVYNKLQSRAWQSRNVRKNKKISNLKNLVSGLKDKQEFDAAKYLQDLPQHLKDLLFRMKDRKPTAPFPAHLRNFAKTLHFHSPAAYGFVRRSFLKCLPCVETLNNWMCSKDYKPGISSEIIEHVSEIVRQQSSQGKKLVFNVTFDEMSIKQWKHWDRNSHQWKGVVDLGGQLDEMNEKDQLKVASKALVFMLVNINGGFKTPVAHYLLNSLSGKEKSILLRDLLIKLSQNNIKVVSVTFDGDKSHATACESLGAHINYHDEKFKPYFEHPLTKEPVYVFYDPCHMLKLVRNYFALKGPIIYDSKEFITWDFIRKLYEKQNIEGLHCACKIRKRHIDFHNEKMKVFLAAQVLSSSVSTALNFLEYELKDKSFENASSTAKFCQMFNDMFDILNIRNKFCKTPGRKGITKAYLPEMKQKIDEYINYIDKLEINIEIKATTKKTRTQLIADKENTIKAVYYNTEKIIEHRPVTRYQSVKTGFCGFIISLKNVYSLCLDLIENNIVEYVLTYKLSQDHVEMFFALIRRMNGFNNNPTTIQYNSAYRKLLLNNLNISVSAAANCTPQDETLIISDVTDIADMKKLNNDVDVNMKAGNEENSSEKEKKRNQAPQQPTVDAFSVTHFLQNNYTLFEHDYSKTEGWCASEYVEEVVKHIAGFVVFSLKKKVHCKKCLAMLEGDNSSKSKITILKNRGGLNFGSNDVNFICHSAEKIIRQNKDLIFTKDVNYKLITETLKTLPRTILDTDNHVLEQEPLSDHRHQLIILILQKYIDTRLSHESNSVKETIERIRMRNNKITLFSGQ